MENLYPPKKSVGAVLITALLFLLILTILTISIVQIGLLETKMSTNYQDKIFSLQQAEINLRQQEQNLKNAEIISTAICGVTFYRIKIDMLQSTYAVIGDTSQCQQQPNITSGRQSWRKL